MGGCREVGNWVFFSLSKKTLGHSFCFAFSVCVGRLSFVGTCERASGKRTRMAGGESGFRVTSSERL